MKQNQLILLLDISFHNEGIAPITHNIEPVGDMIALLDEKSQVKTKRKFRKLWKKALRDACKDAKMRKHPKEIEILHDRVGFGERNPTPGQKLQRKKIVREFLFRKLPLSSVGRADDC